MRNEFTSYYSNAVRQSLESGKPKEDIEVDFHLTTLKPLHAQWLVNMYNFFTLPDGRPAIVKDWKRAGILDLLDGTTILPPEDPFENL